MGSVMGFLTSLVKNGEIRPSHSYKIILEQRQERDQLNSLKEQLMICSSAFWKQKCENLKNVSLMRRSNRNFNIPPPGKPRAFDYFLCPGVGNLTGKAFPGVGNLTLPGWGGEN